jgi:hypothetical protein
MKNYAMFSIPMKNNSKSQQAAQVEALFILHTVNPTADE